MNRKNLISSILVMFIILIGMVGTIFYFRSQQNSSNPQKLLDEFLFSHQASKQIQEAYRFALANPKNILNEIPCYCGCLERNLHKNSRECFIKNKVKQGDGEDFDTMGLNCGTCINIALTAKNLQQQGKSLEEIKETINSKFNQQLN